MLTLPNRRENDKELAPGSARSDALCPAGKREITQRNMSKTLLDKVWEAHKVRDLPNGATQLSIGTHLIHEVTCPQAFGMLRDLGLKVQYPQRTFATVDHIVPTDKHDEPFADPLAAEMIEAIAQKLRGVRRHIFRPSAAAGRASSTSSAPSRGSPSPAPPSPAATRTPRLTARSARSRSASAPARSRDVLATQTMAIRK